MSVRSDFIVDGKKNCPRCKTVKAASEFYVDKKRPSGLRPYCKRCHQEDGSQRQSSEEGKAQARNRANRWYARNPKHARELSRRRELQDRYKARRRIRENAFWRKHPEKRHAKNKEAYALRRGSGGKVSAAQWRRVVEVFGGLCAYCRRPGRTLDHFVAVKTGGRHDISNVVLACHGCNSSKRHRDPFDWMEAKGVDSDLVVALLCKTRHAA